MDLEYINQLIIDKEWAFIVQEIEKSLIQNHVDQIEYIISIFESIDENYRTKHCLQLYLKLWKPALKAGKIKFARKYANNAIEILLKFKRTAFLAQLIDDLKSEGVLRQNHYEDKIKCIIGQISLSDEIVHEEWSLLESHPEKWKSSKVFLKYYLQQSDSWKIHEWRFAYEYVLNFGFEKEIFLILTQKARDLKKSKSIDKFEQFMTTKKIVLPKVERPSLKKFDSENRKLNVDYDELAFDILSGESQPSVDDQRRIIFSLKDMSEQEWMTKGHDMIVAFGLLGMELVVIHIGEKLIPFTADVKKRASIQWMCAQSMFNNKQFHRVIDIANDVLEVEPLLADESLAFEYIKAEALMKLKRAKQAKEIYLKIKKNNPYYRLVSQRLSEIEAS